MDSKDKIPIEGFPNYTHCNYTSWPLELYGRLSIIDNDLSDHLIVSSMLTQNNPHLCPPFLPCPTSAPTLSMSGKNIRLLVIAIQPRLSDDLQGLTFAAVTVSGVGTNGALCLCGPGSGCGTRDCSGVIYPARYPPSSLLSLSSSYILHS